jgi:23S rRNA pseudouridine1911/1915/1917 synthase
MPKRLFVHPTTGEMMRFDTELPQDFRTVLRMERYSKTNLSEEESKNLNYIKTV